MTSELAGKRVLVVARATTMHANAGGMETSAQALIGALHDLGVRTALVTTALGNGTFPSGYQDHEHTWTITTRRPGRYSRAWWRGARWGEAWAAWEPDAVLGIGDAARGYVLGRTRSPVPVFTHAHGTTLMEVRSALAGRSVIGYLRAALNLLRTPSRVRYLNRVDLVVAAGPAIQESLSRWPYSLEPSAVAVVTNSVESDAYSFDPVARDTVRTTHGIAEATSLYLYLGRLAPDKGVARCIDLAASDSNCHLLVIGEGPEATALRARSTRRGLDDRVHFIGRIRPEETVAWMSAADQMWLLTDRYEGLPMVLLEAAANGLPVLTTPRAQLPQELHPGATTVRKASQISRRDLTAPGASRASYLPPAFERATLPTRLAEALRPHLGHHNPQD